MGPVNTKHEHIDPGELRVFCARQGISRRAIAAAMGVSGPYVSQVLHADRTKKAVSQAQLRTIKKIATEILWERERRYSQ